MNKLFLLLISICVCHFACQNAAPTPPLPENGIVDDHGSPLKDSLKKAYFEQLYYADLGTNVDSIRLANWERNYAIKRSKKTEVGERSVSESFANGQLLATWHERGPNNEAGDMRVIDFEPSTEALYGISTVGHLWKGNLNGATWTLLNDDIRFQPDEIEVVPHNSGNRIFAIYGTGVDDKKIRFSDNEGQSWTTGTGFSFYDHWGKGRRLYVLSDNETLYYLAHTWSGNPWGQLFQLYKSTDKGVSYTKVWDTPVNYEGEDVDLWKPYNSDNMYLVDNRAQKVYPVTHNFNNDATTIGAAQDYSAQGIATGGIHVSGKYNSGTGVNELYMIHDSDQRVYKTTTGAAWAFLGTSPENVWVKGWLANPDNGSLYVGGFQLNKSLDGNSWTEQYPQWWRYYSHSKDSMHVDIMNLEYFKKTNGTPFILILNHAGVHITYDNFATTANLGLNSLNIVTLYDQSTATDGFLYCGAQDKGTFKYSGNSLSNFSQVSTDNMTTGDGMIGVFLNSDQSFFSMIQNGTVACLPNRNVNNSYWYTIPGTTKPGWINPMVPTPNFTDNKAYVAGGNLNGGAGSYLITLNVTITSNNVNWSPTQFNYDFRANSNNGTSVIKAIGVANSDPNRLYVATQDATFFSSANQGTSWTKQATAGLPSGMVPWDIKCSNTDPSKVFICGTGFSNNGVFQSNNGGNTFTALTGNMPLATFYEIALSTTEDMLFAATSEGPYVYIFNTAQWYSLMGANTPILDYNTVDNVGNNVVRFGTYGRGVWDFQITSALPVELAQFTAKAQDNQTALLNWTTVSEVNVRDFVVEHSVNGTQFKSIGNTSAKGQNNAVQTYSFVHQTPEQGVNYYRLNIRDNDGQTQRTDIQTVVFESFTPQFNVYPTVLQPAQHLYIQPNHTMPYQFALYNMEGRLVLDALGTDRSTLRPDVPKGTYMYRILSGGRQHTGRIIVQ